MCYLYNLHLLIKTMHAPYSASNDISCRLLPYPLKSHEDVGFLLHYSELAVNIVSPFSILALFAHRVWMWVCLLSNGFGFRGPGSLHPGHPLSLILIMAIGAFLFLALEMISIILVSVGASMKYAEKGFFLALSCALSFLLVKTRNKQANHWRREGIRIWNVTLMSLPPISHSSFV